MEAYLFQIGEAAQLRRYFPSQSVYGQFQDFQVDEPAQFRRYRPGKLIVMERKNPQSGKTPEFRRYFAGQLPPREVQSRDARWSSLYGNAVPPRYRRI